MENYSHYGYVAVYDENDFARYLRKVDGFLKLSAGVLGVVGNTLVFIAFAVSKKLQTKTNILVLNLAVADFMTGIIMPIFAWSLYADVEYIKPWMDVMCGIAMALGQAFVGCSLITLAFIALNRLILITEKKEKYRRMFQARNIIICIAISWITPFVVDTTPLLFGIGELGFDEVTHICGAKSNNPWAYLYDFLVVTLLIPIPMVIIIYSYTRIFLFIRKHNKQLNNSSNSATSNISSVSAKYAADKTTAQAKKERNLKKQVDISKNLFYVIVVFIICLSPHLVAELFDAGPYITNQTKIMGVSNCFMNPILYGFKHPHFRIVFKCILFCRWNDVPQPSRILKSSHGLIRKKDSKRTTHSHNKSSSVTVESSSTV